MSNMIVDNESLKQVEMYPYRFHVYRCCSCYYTKSLPAKYKLRNFNNKLIFNKPFHSWWNLKYIEINEHPIWLVILKFMQN